MAIFASTTLGSSDPSKAMNIKALEARAQALAAAQAKQEVPQSMPSPWQGASHVFNQAADAFATKRADTQAAQQRQDLANLIGQVGPEGPNPQQLGGITARDPELGKTYMTEIASRRAAAAEVQARKEAAAEAAKTAEAAAVSQEARVRGRPQTEGAKIEETVRTGQQTPEQAAEERGKAFGPNAPEIKARTDQEGAHIEAQSFVNSLAEAKDLVDTGVYNGKGAAYQGEYGKGLIGYGTDLVGLTDPKTTQRDDRYNKIMNTVATQMTAAMKGAQSDKELMLALDTARNPNATKEAKQQALDVILKKAQLHAQVSEEAVKSLKGTPKYLEPYKPGSSLALGKDPERTSGIPPDTTGGAAAPAGGDQMAAAKAWLADPKNARDPNFEAVRKKVEGR